MPSNDCVLLEAAVRELLPAQLATANASEPLRELGLESMQMLLFLNALESHFGIILQDEDLDDSNFQTIASVIALVKRVRYRDD